MRHPYPYRRADGTVVWRVRFRLGGRGSRETTETFRTKTAANAFCRDLADLGAPRAMQRLEESLQRAHELPLDNVADEFLAWKTPRVRSDRTIADYRRDYTLWIRPHFGHRITSIIGADDVREWVDGMVDGSIARNGKPAAAKSILDRHALLHQIMDYAVKRKHAVVNPCVGTELPKKRKGTPKGLRPAEWEALHAALRQMSPDAADLAEFLLASGWRWSEATAMTTYDVEDDGADVWVVMSHVGRRNAAGQVVDVQDGKSHAAMRRVRLDPDAAQMVRRRVAWASPGGLVFTTAGGGRWHYGNFRARYWVKAVKLANLSRKPTPHWLRHSSTAWLIMSGASLAEIQARIGHESITTTIGTYGRMVTDVQPDALERFAAMRGGRAALPPAAPSGDVLTGSVLDP